MKCLMMTLTLTMILVCGEGLGKDVQVELFGGGGGGGGGGDVLVVVHGYSTSFKWPAMLQRKLDRYYGGKRVVEVVSALKGGTPIAKWMDVESGEGKDAWGTILVPALKGKGARKVVVLCQQSLQWAFGEDRTEGIDSANDAKDIKRGAEVIGRYVDLLRKDGADEIVIAMHIFKEPMEPAIGNERLALAKYMESGAGGVGGRKGVWVGPDVWVPTKEGYPELFARDKVHPNSVGAELMAHLWFESLLKREGKAVPGWSLKEYEAAQAAGAIEEARGGGGGGGGGGAGSAILRRYDKDGDGKLNAKEQAEFEAAKKVRSGGR